jgi:hypothetical protein
LALKGSGQQSACWITQKALIGEVADVTEDNIHILAAFVGASITLLIGLAGFIITYLNNVRIERKKAEIKFVSDQIERLYGPLFSLTKASEAAWNSFVSRGTNLVLDAKLSPITIEDNLNDWRIWVNEVFMPINNKIETAIVTNCHLIEVSEMPKPFIDFLTHVEVYKAVVKKWETDQSQEYHAYIDYPINFQTHIYKEYARLKSKHSKLIGISKARMPLARVREFLCATDETPPSASC